MFSGSWKESSMNTIELEIPDQNIDIEALQVAFGSLYQDDVLIKSSESLPFWQQLVCCNWMV